jgi:multiple sugar transport system substrate-binding protein
MTVRPGRRRSAPARLAGVVAAAALLGACGLLPGGGGRPSGTGPVTFATGRDISAGRQIERLVELWNDEHPDQQVRFVELPGSADQARAQLAATLQQQESGRGQRYDVMAMDVVWTAEFAQAGYLRRLDDRWVDGSRFLEAPLASARYDGHLWAVPFNTDAGLLYYRTDLLVGSGEQLPSTWDQVADQAARLSARHRGLIGYVGQFRQYEGLTVNVLEQMWGAPSAPSAPPSDEPGDGGDLLALVDSKAAVEGLGFLQSGRCGDGTHWLDPQAASAGEEESRLSFQRGKALFMRNWPYAYRLLQAPDSAVRGRVGVIALPGPSALGGYDLGIAASSPHQRTALDFIAFLTSEQSQRQLFAQGGFAPTLSSLYADPSLQRVYPYMRPLRESVRQARSRAVTPYYNEVTTEIQAASAKVLACTLTPEQAAGQLRRVLPGLLAGHPAS